MKEISPKVMAERAVWRFGLGPNLKSDPEDAVPAEPQRRLMADIERFDPRPAALSAAPSRQAITKATADYLSALRAEGVIGDAMQGAADRKQANAALLNREVRKFLGKSSRDFYLSAVDARIQMATQSKHSFAERLVHFWANHFAVSADKPIVGGFAGVHEFEYIRPHIMGRFADLVQAASLSPAMLIYLDQIQSIGPDSLVGRRLNHHETGGGLNENLAREILELHTLGARGGYSQNDVVQLAHALTGWTVSGLSRGAVARHLNLTDNHGAPAFAMALHQPGDVMLLGKRYGQSGQAQSLAILDDLATHPATARHIATKLAQHFAADTPPAPLVARLEEDFLNSGGDLTSLYKTLITSPEVWQAEGKYTSPWEWIIAINRLGHPHGFTAKQFSNFARVMGQTIWQPGSPAGFGDTQADWLGPDMLFKRIESSRIIAARSLFNMKGQQPNVPQLAQRLFPASLSASTAQELGKAANPSQAYALLLSSPEFLRR